MNVYVYIYADNTYLLRRPPMSPAAAAQLPQLAVGS